MKSMFYEVFNNDKTEVSLTPVWKFLIRKCVTIQYASI
jgi:hypothetical protein